MKMIKSLRKMTIVIMIGILSISTINYAQALSKDNSINQLIDKSDVIKGQAYYLAESVVGEELTKQQKDSYIEQINDLLELIKSYKLKSRIIIMH